MVEVKRNIPFRERLCKVTGSPDIYHLRDELFFILDFVLQG